MKVGIINEESSTDLEIFWNHFGAEEPKTSDKTSDLNIEFFGKFFNFDFKKN